MEDGELEQFKGQFEFHTRRAITEAAPHRAACRYDSADDNDEEEMAINNGEFFDLNMLPDQMPQDLYVQNNTNNNQKHSGLINFRAQKDQEPPLRLTKNMRESTQTSARDNIPLGKPLKPATFGQNTQVPVKVFGNTSTMMGQGSSSGYNSQKNLKNKVEYCNQTVNGPSYGNNRYSSQNMKGSCDEFDDDDDQIDEGVNGLEVAEENCGMIDSSSATHNINNQCARTEIGGARIQGGGFESHLQTEVAFSEVGDTLSQTYRRGSYKYKDRINTIRMQSQETYQREHMIGPTYFTQANAQDEMVCQDTQQDNELEMFERAQPDNIYSQRSRYLNKKSNKNNNNHQNYNETQTNNGGADFSELQITNQQQQHPAKFKSRYDNNSHNQKRWTTQPVSEVGDVPQIQRYMNYDRQQDYGQEDSCEEEEQQDDDATPKQDMSQMYLDSKNGGAHFQYRELIKRLSDMTNSSKDKNSSRKSKGQRQKVRQNETEGRIPLKEKTQEIVNQQQLPPSSSKKKKYSVIDPSGKMRPYCNSAKPTKKDTKKVQNQNTEQNNLKVSQNQQITNNQAVQNKVTKLLLNNQENHFIDKKLRDLQGNNNDQQLNQTKGNISKNITMNQNKSHQNLHKSSEKTLNKLNQHMQQSQINNMKLNKASMASVKLNSNAPIQQNSNLLKNQSLVQQPQINQQIIINNILTNNALSSSISSSSTGGVTTSNFTLTSGINGQQILNSGGGTFSSGIKCPSSNLLRTATTAAFTTTTTNKSSAKLTQCNSNKQINKETPETTSRQKFRLTSGTALSSTNKRNNLNSAGGGTTLSNNSQGNTIQNSQNNMHAVIQSQFGYQDSGNKRSQNSEQKDLQNITNKSHNGNPVSQGQINSGTNTHPSSVPRSNSSNKKVCVQKMIKNQSFLKGTQKDGVQKKQVNNEFYNTVLQNLQNGKLGLTNLGSGQSQINITLKNNPHQIMNSHLTQNIQNHIQPRLSDTKKSTIGQSSKTTRVSGVGVQSSTNPQIIQTGTITNPPSKPQSRLSQGKKTTINHKQDYLTGQVNIESGMSQITNNIKRISDMLQAHQQSPTSQNDYFSRKNSNKTLKDDDQINEKSMLGKQSSNGQKFNQYFMKINMEQQQQQQQLLANQSQLQMKQSSGSSTQLNQHSILLNHQVNKNKQTSQLTQNRMAFSQASSTINTGRPFSGGNNCSQTDQFQILDSNICNDKLLQTQGVQRKVSTDKQQQMHLNSQQQYMHDMSNIYMNTQPSSNIPQQQQNYQTNSQNQMYLQTQQYETNLNQNNDNRQSLQVQHKTVEKKTALTAQQQALQQKLSQNRNQYLIQKKEEMAQATSKTLNSRYQQQQHLQQNVQQKGSNMNMSTNNNQTSNNIQEKENQQNEQNCASKSTLNKKSYLMANLKIPKSNNQQLKQQQQPQQLSNPYQNNYNLMTQQQEAYERMHLPTEEDDYCNPSHLNGQVQQNSVAAQKSLITNSQYPQQQKQSQLYQHHHNNQVVMTEVYQLNNLMETEGDQYDIYNNMSNIVGGAGASQKINGSYLANQQQQHQQQHKQLNTKSTVQQSNRYGNSNSSSNNNGGTSKHSVKVKPKHF